MEAKTEGRPLQLIRVTEENQLQVVEDTCQSLIRAMNRSEAIRLHVWSIMSQIRLGKSTCLNWILHSLGVNVSREHRFETKNGGLSVTKGLWIWSQPIRLPNGDYLLLIDTQGVGSGNESINTQLSTISCLLASVLIINMDGGLDETNRTLLFAIQNFAQRLTGVTGTDNVMPRLLFRTRNYDGSDFKRDFKQELALDPSLATLPLNHPRLCQVLNAKLTRDWKEVVDTDLKESSRVILEKFPHQEWLFTRSPEDEQDQKALREQTMLPRDATLFSNSMWNITDRLLAMSQPKRFGSSLIEFKVLLPYLRQMVQRLEDEKARFHIPTVIEALQEDQVEIFIQESKNTYEYGWNTDEDHVNDLKELEVHDNRQREVAIALFTHRCEEHKISDLVVESGRERLHVLLSTSFLTFQEYFRRGLFERIEELKSAALRDEAKQEEITHDIQNLQSQVAQVGNQISQMQVEVNAAQRRAQEAEDARSKAEAYCRQMEQSHQGGRGGNRSIGCIIL